MNDELFKKLTTLLKLFNNRPHHLAKFLLESDAFTLEFISIIRGFDDVVIEEKFKNINEINEYFNRFLVVKDESGGRVKKMEKDLNNKLEFLLEMERYEDAARVRDYMIKNKIKINK
jgi:hypothetical protein